MELPNLNFPNLSAENHKITSPPTVEYNCIAWAAKAESRWWWPVEFAYWPKAAPQEETIAAFVIAFELQGYQLCDTDEFEIGSEKVAIYADKLNQPTHMARQLATGEWSSKLGKREDITHKTLADLAGPIYGRVVKILKRRLG